MATKSDFAQKLLNDLRVRKERMTAAQNSSRQSTQTPRVAQGNTGQTSRGSRQINTQQSASSTSRRSSANSRPINLNEPSNQIVLYGNGQSSRQQVKDLPMAIAFAFESNGKNFTNIGASNTNNPLVNFFNRFGRKTRGKHKMDIATSFDSRTLSTTQFSNVHISEVSKGVQKLNQVLRACSSDFSFDGNSIEVGEKLLKGAIDLEESLRVLMNLQDASQYTNTTQKKSQLKLLEEDEDDENEDAKIAEQWKLDRPKFSFDKPSRNSRVVRDAKYLSLLTQVVSHKRQASYIQDLGLSTQVKQNSNSNNNNNSSSAQSTHEKRRISNVVAKLMGLDEIDKNEDFIMKKNDSKVSKQNNKLSEPLNRERNNQQRHTVAANQGNGHQIIDDRRKQTPTRDKQSRIAESERKMLVSNTELQQKAQDSKTLKADDKTHDRIGYTLGANSIERRNANKDLPRNQQKPQDQRVLLQEHVHKNLGNKHEKEQHLTAKTHEGRQVESKITIKPKKSVPGKKKLSHDKPASDSKKTIKPTEKQVPTKDQRNRANQDDAPVIDISRYTTPDKENIKKEEIIHELDFENKNKNLVPTREKPVEVSAKQKAVVPKKVQRSEIPQKIDVLMSRRNANTNHLTRSIKQPANNMLKDLKQRMHNKNHIGKRMEEQSDNMVKDEKEGTSGEMNTESVKKQDKLQNEDDQIIVIESYTADENQKQNVQNTPTLNDDSDTTALNSEKGFGGLETVEQPHALKDEQKLKQCDQNKGDNIEEQRTELYNISQHRNKQVLASERHEQLTEPEKELKEIVIKSQSFLSTSDVLFKLNIPVSYLHAAEQDYEVSGNKLVLNCAYEVMKRKARRHENANNPYMKATISCPKVRSLDDLIKQLCKDLDTLIFYGGDASNESDVAARLYKMLEKDIYHKDADVNSMWDFEWSNIQLLVPEKEDVVRDVERYMLNDLLDEVTNDLLLLTVSV